MKNRDLSLTPGIPVQNAGFENSALSEPVSRKDMGQIAPAPVSRREMGRLARTFGWTSLLMALTSMGGDPLTISTLADAAQNISKKRSSGADGGYGKRGYAEKAGYSGKTVYTGKPRRTLTYAITITGKRIFQINGFGYLEFIRDLEERTDGEIRIELIPGGEICNEMTCVKKAMQGIVDIYSSSIQNAAGIAEYFNVLNFPGIFPDRASQHHFFYHPKSEKLLREPLRKHHGLHLLFTHCRLRGLTMGMKWREKPDIKSIDDLKGAKIRVTASKFGQKALELLGIVPVPMDWGGTLNAMKFGLVDGMETWETAAAGMAFEQSGIISQVLDLRLFSGNTHAAIRTSVFESLSPDLQVAMMESAYYTQIWGQLAGEASLINMAGASEPQMQGTVFSDQGIRYVKFSEKELHKIQQRCAPCFNPQPWEEWREKLNRLAGNVDIYQEIFNIAREIPLERLPENVLPRRWWKKV
ncbi:Twin-arginine translocation pathway signal [Desulfamplus magnetovallimortis]|uniref:Twin-arginine translocation pathway signal n=1 Tax=Desulfamplus magnetovallimortis TaxID=1246637 RepID=A0A1W1H6T8_9BACT|nr:TRAP transporter substrate-binding protein DctP [Desulfamplus magnetovallimortis]SLM28177.1 Twin-arginine translocation pathway signal [Desulfamplus magnetovallimortis]